MTTPTTGKGPRHLIGVVLANVGVLGTFFLYVGWVRAKATVAFFGLDPSVTAFTSFDYLLRSPDSAVASVLGLSLFTIVPTTAHRSLVKRLPRASRSRRKFLRASVVLRRCALAATALAIVGWMLYDALADPVKVLLPPVLSTAAGMAAYTSAVLLRFDSAWAAHAGPHGYRYTSFALVGACVTGALTGATWYADHLGGRAGADAAASLPREPAWWSCRSTHSASKGAA